MSGVFRDIASTAVSRASFSVCSERVKVWVFGLPWGLIQLGESQNRQHLVGGGRDVGGYYSHKWKRLKLKTEFRQQKEKQG